MSADLYQSPFSERYASREMAALFSPTSKYTIWRQLWLALARAEMKLGLPITQKQIDQLQAHLSSINFERVAHFEKLTEHDVMAHLHAYAELCPEAKPILHLGATSCYITDNCDLIQMQRAMQILKSKLLLLIKQLSDFARKYRNMPCLAYTHLQAAQPTTVGKRASLWLQDFLSDYEELLFRQDRLQFLGLKGTTGTQASFLTLFNGDDKKVKQLEDSVAEELGFTAIFAVTGQTYPRKQDSQVVHFLAGMAISAHKFATDLRLLCHLKEIEEPFSATQVGSSAMPYKRNPIKAERVCSLSRFLVSLAQNADYTAATQWLERSLDDSANRRITLPEAFLCADAILELLLGLTKGLVVNPKMIERHLNEELPFLISEEILMAGVKKGGDRQLLHEKLREHASEASQNIKLEGKENDFCERILADSLFQLSSEEISSLLHPARLIGRAPQQTEEFLDLQVKPLLKDNKM